MCVKPEMFPDVSGWGRGSGATWPGVDRGLPRPGLRLFIIRSNGVFILLVLAGMPVPTEYTYSFFGWPYHLDNVWIAAECSGHHLTRNSFGVLRSNFLGKEQIGLELSGFQGHRNAAWTTTWGHNGVLNVNVRTVGSETGVPEQVEHDTEEPKTGFVSVVLKSGCLKTNKETNTKHNDVDQTTIFCKCCGANEAAGGNTSSTSAANKSGISRLA